MTYVRHPRKVVTLYNRFWLVVPSLIVLQLGKDISSSLLAAEHQKKD
jgi:hypothetical protein